MMRNAKFIISVQLSSAPFGINIECEDGLACERIGHLTFRAPVVDRPQFIHQYSIVR